MHLINIKTSYRVLCLVPILLSACGGGSGSVAATGTTTVRSAYVANYGANNISQYTIDPTTGALTPKTTATVAAGINPTSVVVDPSGKHAYVANSVDSFISQYTIGAGGGLVAMTPVQSGSAPGAGPISIAISGGYAYAANNTSIGDVTQFSIDPTTGVLTNLATVVAGINPVYVAVTPDPAVNKYAYVVNAGVPVCYAPVGTCVVVAPTISEYSINSTTGALTLIATATLGLGTAPASITVDSAGKFAYVANFGTPASVASTIEQYSIASGILTPVASVGTSTLLSAATSIAIDPAGTHAYVANGSGVYQYSINNVNGLLSDIVTTPPVAPTIYAGGFTQRSIAINEGKFVYMANQGSDDISQFSIGPGGDLTIIGSNLVGAANSQPYSITTAVSIQ